MLLNRIGKIEEETQLTDLDKLEEEIEREIVTQVNNDNVPAGLQGASLFFRQAPCRPACSSFTGGGTRSKFAQQPSSFFPGQPSETRGKASGANQPLLPLSYFQKRAQAKAPANDDARPFASRFYAPQAARRGLARMTVEALVSLGAVPLRMLIELGRFRYAKQRKFNSRLRLEKALAEGHEDGEQFLRFHPGALRKKERAMTFGL